MANIDPRRKDKNFEHKNSMMTVFFLALLALSLSALIYPYCHRKLMIKRWYSSLALDTHLSHYQPLYQDIDGFKLSQQARARVNAIDYTYGEIEFISFVALLSLVKPNINTVFYDLGSGTGKAVLACAMVFNVRKSCGIELFEALHHTALNQKKKLQQLPGYQKQASNLYFIHANFLHCDFSDATIIFINATAFFGDTWIAIQQRLFQLEQSTIIITTSKKLPANQFVLIKETNVRMSWGIVKAYIQHRA